MKVSTTLFRKRTPEGVLFKALGMAVVLLLFWSGQVAAQTYQWTKQMVAVDTITGVREGVWDIARDGAGNIYITGEFEGTTDFDPGPNTAYIVNSLAHFSSYLAKYDADGNYLWAKRIMTGTDHSTGARALGLAVSPAGDVVYVTGEFTGTAYFETSSGTDSVTGSAVHDNFFLNKYDSSGQLIWVNAMTHVDPGSTGGGPGESKAVVIDGSGDVYITGFFEGTYDFNPGPGVDTLSSVSSSTFLQSNLFLAKYHADGTYVWAKRMGGTGYAEGFAMALDPLNNVLYVTGQAGGDTVDFDPGPGTGLVMNQARGLFLAKYDTAGNYLWAKGMAPDAGFSVGRNLAVDTFGNVLVTGNQVAGTADFDPGPDTALVTAGTALMVMFLAKYDPAGTYLWAFGIEGAAGSASTGNDLSVDDVGNVYVLGGYSGGAVDFAPGPDTLVLTPGPGYVFSMDMFVAKYGSCGTAVWAVGTQKNSVNSAVVATGMTLNDQGDAFLAGGFAGTVDFDTGPGTDTFTVPVSGQTNIFLTKMHFEADSIPTLLLTEISCSDSFTLNGQTYTASGIYRQQLAGTVTCDSVIVLDLTLSEVAEPIIRVDGFTLSLTQTYATYQWLKDSVLMPGETNSTLQVTENADYQVVVTNADGCVDTSAIYTVNNVDIDDVSTISKQIKVWPNPSRGKLYIQSPVPVSATLYDIEGRVILQQENAHMLSLERLAAGIYMLQCTDSEGRVLKYEKVAKQP